MNEDNFSEPDTDEDEIQETPLETEENTENDPFATFGETVTLDDGFLD